MRYFILVSLLFSSCHFQPINNSTSDLDNQRELQDRPQHMCYTGMRGFTIVETACDGAVCLELQTAANEGLKSCPKRRVGWPNAVNSCRIAMCDFLDHPRARGFRKKGNTYCAVKDALMLCCCRGRLCNGERLSYADKRSNYGDGEYFDTSKCPPKEKIRNFTLMEELSNEDFHKICHSPDRTMFTLFFFILLSAPFLNANPEPKPFQCYLSTYDKPDIKPINCTGPTCLTHVTKQGPQPSCDIEIPNSKGSDRISCIITLCSFVEIAEKAGEKNVVENLGKIGDTLCLKNGNTLVCCCEGHLCNTPESTQPFVDKKEGDKSAFSKESCPKKTIA